MISRPLVFTVLAFVHLVIALAFPVQIARSIEVSLLDWQSWYYHLAPMNFIVMVLALLQAAALWRASRMLIVVGFALAASIAWNNYVVASYALNASVLLALSSALVYPLSYIVLLAHGARLVLKDPNKRWWLIPRRIQCELPVRLLQTGTTSAGVVFDLSRSGCFIRKNHAPIDENDPILIRPDDVLALDLPFGNSTVCRCEGRVVRHTSSDDGRYPAGVGIQFTNISWLNRFYLLAYLYERGQEGER